MLSWGFGFIQVFFKLKAIARSYDFCLRTSLTSSIFSILGTPDTGQPRTQRLNFEITKHKERERGGRERVRNKDHQENILI
jgi:hypothetical protein